MLTSDAGRTLIVYDNTQLQRIEKSHTRRGLLGCHFYSLYTNLPAEEEETRTRVQRDEGYLKLEML